MKQVIEHGIGIYFAKFDTIEELKVGLLKIGCGKDTKHEKAHFDMLTKLRYTPVCGYVFSACQGDYLWADPQEDYRSIEDVIKVALAPENPSKADLEIASSSLNEVNAVRRAFLNIFDKYAEKRRETK